MRGGLPSRHHVDQALRRVFAARVGEFLTMRWREGAGWSQASHTGTIVAAGPHGVRVSVQSAESAARFPEWIAYCDLWISADSPYRTLTVETPALQNAIDAVLIRLQFMTGPVKEVNPHVAPVA